MNPFNRPNNQPNRPPATFKDPGEKVPLRVNQSAGGENTGDPGDNELAYRGGRSKGPNVGAPTNGTLTDEQTESAGTANVAPGGNSLPLGQSIDGSNMQFSREGGREYAGKEVRGSVEIEMFGGENKGLANNPSNPKVVSNPNIRQKMYG